jgi:AbrB family looped-hinge helix DNA binding protein
MRVTSKGQVTIPLEIRERLGLLPGCEVEFTVLDSEVRLRKVKGDRRRGRAIVEHLRGRGTIRMTTDEIMALTRGEA